MQGALEQRLPLIAHITASMYRGQRILAAHQKCSQAVIKLAGGSVSRRTLLPVCRRMRSHGCEWATCIT